MGRAVKYGDNVNTDVILPGRYLVLTDPHELARHAMEGIDEGFAERARDGVVLIAGRNFGCGSSREQAPIALKHAGVRCVVAESFARTFYRNAISIGLPVLRCEGITDGVDEGDEVSVSLERGEVMNRTRGTRLRARPLQGFLLGILESGGLIEHLRRRCTG